MNAVRYAWKINRAVQGASSADLRVGCFSCRALGQFNLVTVLVDG